MRRNLLFAGIDVDDQMYHVSIISEDRSWVCKGVRCPRRPAALLKMLKKFNATQALVGYEATYLGYSLQRELSDIGINCKVIAPGSIARAPADRVKTDRIDSIRLAEGLRRDEFKFVSIPTRSQEADRQLIRGRDFLVRMRSDLKRHILSQCRLVGIDYKAATGKLSYWTKTHLTWLDQQLAVIEPTMQFLFIELREQLESLNRRIHSLEVSISELAATPAYKDKVEALRCFRGIEVLTAMTILTEVFDISRFKHPAKLVSYLGLDIAEYSSGGKQRQFGVTKMGNKRLRTALIESCQMFGSSSTPSKRLQAVRKGYDPQIIKIADRCQERLYCKGRRLLARGKPRNKVKVMAAREMVGFIWEALNKVA